MAKKDEGKDESQAPPETVSKMEAVRRLLQEDPDMKPGDGVEAVKERFGLEMSTNNFSAYKSQIRSKKDGGSAGTAGAAEGQPAKGKGGRPKGSGKKAPAATATGGANPLEAAQQVKALVDRYGAGTVKGLAELFGQEGHG